MNNAPEANTTIDVASETNDIKSETQKKFSELSKDFWKNLSNPERNKLTVKLSARKIPELQQEVDSNSTKTKADLDDLKFELNQGYTDTEQAERAEQYQEKTKNAVKNNNKPEENIGINEDNLPINENWEEISVAEMWPEGIPDELNN